MPCHARSFVGLKVKLTLWLNTATSFRISLTLSKCNSSYNYTREKESRVSSVEKTVRSSTRRGWTTRFVAGHLLHHFLIHGTVVPLLSSNYPFNCLLMPLASLKRESDHITPVSTAYWGSLLCTDFVLLMNNVKRCLEQRRHNGVFNFPLQHVL